MILWIGGSSGLTRTYCSTYPNHDTEEPMIVLGRESMAPHWCHNDSTKDDSNKSSRRMSYISCDLVELANASPTTTTTRTRPDGTEAQTNHGSRLLNRVLEQLDRAMAKLSGHSSPIDDDDDDQSSTTTTPRSISIDRIVVGLRPPLVTARSHVASERYGQALVRGLRLLLTALLFERNTLDPLVILHVSSIAAVDHVKRQHCRSIASSDPPLHALVQPYDRFKRGCEDLIQELCHSSSGRKNAVAHTNLRLGAIFSDTPNCIQCAALALQCYTGPYLPVRIDCNSSRNASHMIHLILQYHTNNDTATTTTTNEAVGMTTTSTHVQRQQQHRPLRPVYYYTRCLSQYPNPVPYGEFLLAYYTANHERSDGNESRGGEWREWVAWLVRHVLWVPSWLVRWGFVEPWHWCTVFVVACVSSQVLFLESIDYLLQVTTQEHSFDMKETLADFPEILQLEETMLACFQRRRRMFLLETNKRHAMSPTTKKSFRIDDEMKVQ